MAKYLTVPPDTTAMPRGVPYIIGNEAAERFSFYGMRGILVAYMTTYLLAADGTRAVLGREQANEWYHWFVTAAYFTPILGALVSDGWLGKYRTIVWLSLVYCLGHLALALDETRVGLLAGLCLIAFGTGAIKPCVSAHVGDQFGSANQHLLSKVFGWFYFSINVGATVSMWLTPLLLDHPQFGPRWAFGVPGVLMALATFVFWLGRNTFVHVPAGGWSAVREAFQGDARTALRGLVPVYVCVMVFWSLFDQTGSSWVHQARRMDLRWLGVDWLPSQIQAVNSVLVLAFIPLFAYVVYPAISRVWPLTPLRKIGLGLALAVTAGVLPAWIESRITGGEIVSATSEGDRLRWAVENLLDGQANGGGWVSGVLGAGENGGRGDGGQEPSSADAVPLAKAQEIVVRLRERKAWSIDAVRVAVPLRLHDFHRLQEHLKRTPTDDDVRRCWAREIEVYAGTTRLGDEQPGATGDERWRWTRRLGSLTLDPRDGLQTLSFPSVSAEYVLIRIVANGGGAFVGLGEIEVNGSSAGAGNSAGAAVNVAATGFRPSVVWQLIAYILLTAAEVMVSITCLEFSYTQAPNKLKSFIMALYLLSISAGNALTALVNLAIQRPDGGSRLEGPAYFLLFAGLLVGAVALFLLVTRTYRGQTFIQGAEAPAN